MIILENVTKTIGGQTLFENVNITFAEGKRIGLTGPNGCGKSTLLKMIIREEEPTSGSINTSSHLGFLRQNIEDFNDFMILDTVIMGNARLWDVMSERDKLYESEITDEIGLRLGEIEGIIAEEDGYSAESDAEILLEGTGIPKDMHQKKMSEIPLDLQFRTLLCQAIFGSPQALILDEPTNHLDLESISWLEDFLTSYKGALIVVSHDKHFLNSITTHIADIDYETIIMYPGNYDSMLMAKTASRETLEGESKSKEKKIAKLQEFVMRFRAGSRSSQVQSRMREIGRLKPQELKKSNITRPYIRFSVPEKKPGKSIFNLEGVSKAYNIDEPVITNFSLEIYRGEKIAVIGNNGMGKSTLLKMLAGVLQPDSGKIALGHEISIGYFPQVHEDLMEKKDNSTSIFDWLNQQRTGLYEQDLRAALGKMLFSGDDAFKVVEHLSGGETARLILASMMLNEDNVLVLDEPNGHLDLESVSALAWGLEDFEGTVVFAAHDRDLINHVATKIISIENDGICIFESSFDDYLKQRKLA